MSWKTTIHKLPQEVINRIAAGEVVQRPSSALKEMLENSYDAGATQIDIVCQDGGMTLLQISDNGCGIHPDDLPLLCERFATSKLEKLEDLQAMRTYGFRGEAMASISHVARVTVVTMPSDGSSNCAFEARFVDGKMIYGPKKCSGTPGTVIQVEDLFYNSQLRKRALSRTSEEYSRVVDCISKYALVNPSVGVTCRSTSGGVAARLDVAFPRNSTTISNVRTLYGNSVAQNLIPIEFGVEGEQKITDTNDENGSASSSIGFYRVRGYASTLEYHNKRTTFILFVNGRLVDNLSLRKCVDQAYGQFLVGGNKPFVLLQVAVDPAAVDVNVHPTKQQVFLLAEDAIVRALYEELRQLLNRCVAAHAVPSSSSKSSGDRAIAQQLQQGLRPAPANGTQSQSASQWEKGKTPAPMSMVRVESQRGAILKYLVPKDKAGTQTTEMKGEGACFDRDEVPVTIVGTREPVNLLDDDDAICESEGTRRKEVICVDGEENVVENKEHASAVSNTLQENSKNISSRESEPSDVKLPEPATGKQNTTLLSITQTAFLMSDSEEDSRDGNGLVDFRSTAKTCTVDSSTTEKQGLDSEPSGPQVSLPSSSSTRKDKEQPVEKPLEELTEPILPSSVVSIIREFSETEVHPDLYRVFQSLVYVGMASEDHLLAQSGTALFKLHVPTLVEHVCYQRCLLLFGKAPRVKLHNPIPVKALLDVATASKSGSFARQQKVEEMLVRLNKWKCMLAEYFSVVIDAEERLCALPAFLGRKWNPDPSRIPFVLLELATVVDYSNETACFSQVARAVAFLFTARSSVPVSTGFLDSEGASETKEKQEQLPTPECVDRVQFHLLPALTSPEFFPSSALLQMKAAQVVVTVEELYKVFERC